MNTLAPNAVSSTTGTTPIEFAVAGPRVRIYDEAGSAQVHDLAAVLDALAVVPEAAVFPSDGPVEMNDEPDYQDLWIESAYSAQSHLVNDVTGSWRVSFAEPDEGSALSTRDAAAYVKECTRVISIAEQLNATKVVK